MKKTALFASVVAISVTSPVLAQNSVTLYGVIDEGINYTNNAGTGSAWQAQAGYSQGTRWGLKGSEDLGGGLKTIFQLENGFNLNNGKLGQGGLMFGRQAYVGLANDYGTLTLGRQYSAINDYFTYVTGGGLFGGYLFTVPYDNDNAEGSFRVNNTLKYTSPTIGGFSFGGTYSFSNDVNFANNRAYSVGAQYSARGLLANISYLQADSPSSSATGAITNAGDQNFLAARTRIFGAGLQYAFGKTSMTFAYSRSNYLRPTSSEYVGSLASTAGTISSLTFDNFDLSALYAFTPSFFLGGQYDFTRANEDLSSGDLHPTYHNLGLMADYFLSKRTDVYCQAAYQHVSGDRTGSVLDFAYVPGSANVSSTSSQIVLRVGLRQKF